MGRVNLFLSGLLLAAAVTCAQQPPDPNYPPIYGQPANQPEPQDQPGQPVARMGVMNGEVSVRRGDSGDWVAAAINAPLLEGDSIYVGPGGSVEMQLDYANFLRIGGDSEIRISQLENGRNQIQVSKGLVTWRVLRDSNSLSEISTPSAAARPLGPSAVRAEVSPDGSTRIIVRKGEAEVSTARGTQQLREGSMMLLRGDPNQAEFQIVYAPQRDGWDTWNEQRDAFLERAQSPRYVSQDIYGTEDLDQYGRWGYDPAYGNVWTPSVADNWAPYRNGQWVWEDYYGWTWVDSDPWGWAPFHYGTWYLRAGYGWTWFPGARSARFWWHPAMVGFFGFGDGVGVGFGFGNVGWVPLAPFEPYHPWYGRGWYGGRSAFVNVNIVRNVNVYNTYRNARFANGVTAVRTTDFQRGSFRNTVAVDRGSLQQASLVRGGVPVAPTNTNLRFSERNAAIPRGDASSNQRFFSRMPATASMQRTPFAQQQSAVRSSIERGGIGGGYNSSPQQPASSGWRRFGEPGAAGAGQGVGRAFQSGASAQAGRPPAESWNRFGSPQPQRFAQPAPNEPARPAYNGGYSGRSLQVAPPIVEQRRAPQPSYRTAPQPSAPAYRSAPPQSYRPAPTPAPNYRSAPAAPPSYRSAPAPSYRSAPPASGPRNNGGGGVHSNGRR